MMDIDWSKFKCGLDEEISEALLKVKVCIGDMNDEELYSLIDLVLSEASRRI